MVNAATLAELAPSGILRVGINYGNPVLVQRNPQTGELSGVAPDLAREFARTLGLPIELLPYDGAGKMADAAKTGAWDVAFLAVDPLRAADIRFTAPYVEIEGIYLVQAGSTIKAAAEVDRPGVRVAATAKSAYDLHLTRNLKHATLVRAEDYSASVDLLLQNKADVLAGVKQPVLETAASLPGSRVLEPRFMAILQASGVPVARAAAARCLAEFIEQAKASGLVARALAKSGNANVSVAPASPAL